MIFDMSTATYTFWHVLISLVGIGSGLIVMFGFLTGKRFDLLTAIFLATTVFFSAYNFRGKEAPYRVRTRTSARGLIQGRAI